MTESTNSLRSEVAALKQRIAELESHERQLDLVIRSTGVGIWDWNVQTGETVFNERWANIIGYTLDELAPVSIETWIRFAHPDDLEESNRLLNETWSGKTDYYIFESRMRHKDGRWIWVYDTGQVIEWERQGVPRRMIGTHLDITERKESAIALEAANAELNRLSYTDPLTKAPNRRAYNETLAREVASSKPCGTKLSFLILDIDHFKQYNDTYGHAAGDVALSSIATTLRNTLPRSTDFFARYGGEEFTIILPGTDADGAASVADKILRAVLQLNIEHSCSKFAKSLTVSIGVTSSEYSDYQDLFAHADQALYHAKSRGRNRFDLYSQEEKPRAG